MRLFIFLSMIFLHVYNDFHLQTSWVSDRKQREWWEKTVPNEMYKHDYIAVLAAHSISWSFLIMLPIAAFRRLEIDWIFAAALAANAVFYGLVDNEYANCKRFNLIDNQMFHLLQVVFTALIFLCAIPAV